MVQETEKMVTKEEAENSSSRNNVGGDESEAEEGEIVAGNSDDAEALKAMASPLPRHPLEHAWTFWFDNPSAKQTQAAWESQCDPFTPSPLSKTSGVVNVRARHVKIAPWTKNAANEAAQLSIGRRWEEFLDYNDSIGFIFHEEAKRLDRGAKNRYTV